MLTPTLTHRHASLAVDICYAVYHGTLTHAVIAAALVTLDYPVELKEATSRFRGDGGPLLNLLRAPCGAYMVVIVQGVRSKHCVMLSTLREKHAPFGKLIDNHGKMLPVYLQKKDRLGKQSAKKARKLFIGQNPAVRGHVFTVDLIDVYTLGR